MTQTKKKSVLVIENGLVLFATDRYGDAWAFCEGLKHRNTEIFKAWRMPEWSPATSPDTNKKR